MTLHLSGGLGSGHQLCPPGGSVRNASWAGNTSFDQVAGNAWVAGASSYAIRDAVGGY